jgi:hypothetical protein
MYFVANKINLRNKYQKEIQLNDDLIRSMEVEKENLAAALKNSKTDTGVYCAVDFGDCLFNEAKRMFESDGQSATILPQDEHFPDVKSFQCGPWQVTFADLNPFSKVTYFFIKRDGRRVLEEHLQEVFGMQVPERFVEDARWGGEDINAWKAEAKGYASRIIKLMKDGLYLGLAQKAGKEKLRRYDEELRWMKENSFLCYGWPQGPLGKFGEEVKARREKKEFYPYCDEKGKLSSGMATPLKIVFAPQAPYYPLEISRLGEGSALVDIYVFGPGESEGHRRLGQRHESRID